jgi:hypothetical protein
MKKSDYSITSELNNPRCVFNWGYHSAWQDTRESWPIQEKFNNPFYKEGYFAGLNENQKGIEYKNNSNPAWFEYVNNLSLADYQIVRGFIEESLIVGWETLFAKKRIRSNMPEYTKIEIQQRVNEDMPERK